MTDFTFRNPAPDYTEADLAARYPALPDGWTPADDVALWEGLFRGLKLAEIGLPRGKTLDEMQSRFLAFRHAATDGRGAITLTAQTLWLKLARERNPQ